MPSPPKAVLSALDQLTLYVTGDTKRNMQKQLTRLRTQLQQAKEELEAVQEQAQQSQSQASGRAQIAERKAVEAQQAHHEALNRVQVAEGRTKATQEQLIQVQKALDEEADRRGMLEVEVMDSQDKLWDEQHNSDKLSQDLLDIKKRSAATDEEKDMAAEVFARQVVDLREQNRGLKRKAEEAGLEVERREQRLVNAECTLCHLANNNVLLECGHKLCSTCLDRLQEGHLPTCPFCRQKINSFTQI